MTAHLDPEAFQSEYEEEQRVMRELAQEAEHIAVAGLVIDLALAKLEAEMRELGEEPIEPEFYEPEEDCPLDGDAESALASAGFGTDEDYGYYGYEDGGDIWADG